MFTIWGEVMLFTIINCARQLLNIQYFAFTGSSGFLTTPSAYPSKPQSRSASFIRSFHITQFLSSSGSLILRVFKFSLAGMSRVLSVSLPVSRGSDEVVAVGTCSSDIVETAIDLIFVLFHNVLALKYSGQGP